MQTNDIFMLNMHLQLENLLLDAAGNLKVSDFGLSALTEQVKVQLELLLINSQELWHHVLLFASFNLRLL